MVLRLLDSRLTLRPLSLSDYSPTDKKDATDRKSIQSFDTIESTSSGSSIYKFKSLGAHIRSKPLPRYLQGSIRKHAPAEIELARVGHGVWRDQLLIDRSLHDMAALKVTFAVAMIVVGPCTQGIPLNGAIATLHPWVEILRCAEMSHGQIQPCFCSSTYARPKSLV
jgi:hypothetical protein